MMILVIRQKDDLNREAWTFISFQRHVGSPIIVLLNFYSIEERLTKRHKWACVRLYNRLSRKSGLLEVSEVPMPDDVRQEALARFIETVRVVKEDEEKK